MQSSDRRSFLALVISFVAVLVSLGAARVANAAGSVQVKSTTIEESDGRWKLNMTVDYGSKPHLAHVPMLFEFTQTVHYERTLTDESPKTPILNRIPMRNQQPINESMDVGFSDGSGEIFQKTKFNFLIRRDRGFEAGEYTLKIKRSTDMVPMGQPIRLVLKGDNPIVDRRSIVFVPGDKRNQSAKEGGDKGKEGGDAPKKDPEGADAPGDDAPSDDGMDEGMDEGSLDEAPGPDPVEPKQGGCGCRVVGAEGASPAGRSGSLPAGGELGLALAGLAALVLRRRAS
jgi:hypothetical protein